MRLSGAPPWRDTGYCQVWSYPNFQPGNPAKARFVARFLWEWPHQEKHFILRQAGKCDSITPEIITHSLTGVTAIAIVLQCSWHLEIHFSSSQVEEVMEDVWEGFSYHSHGKNLFGESKILKIPFFGWRRWQCCWCCWCSRKDACKVVSPPEATIIPHKILSHQVKSQFFQLLFWWCQTWCGL